MKTLILATTLSLVLSAFASAGPNHDHEKKEAGPNGGKILTSVEPHVEFFVTPERKVKLTFLGETGKATAPAGQVVTAIGGDRTQPTRLSFTPVDGALVSDKPLPDGNMIPLILQVKVFPDAKTVTQKFMVNLAECSGCKHKEYACTCGH